MALAHVGACQQDGHDVEDGGDECCRHLHPCGEEGDDGDHEQLVEHVHQLEVVDLVRVGRVEEAQLQPHAGLQQPRAVAPQQQAAEERDADRVGGHAKQHVGQVRVPLALVAHDLDACRKHTGAISQAKER